MKSKMELNDSLHNLSEEEQKKATFLMEAEYILQQVNHNQITIAEGHLQLIKLLGEKEMEAVLESLYNRISS